MSCILGWERADFSVCPYTQCFPAWGSQSRIAGMSPCELSPCDGSAGRKLSPATGEKKYGNATSQKKSKGTGLIRTYITGLIPAPETSDWSRSQFWASTVFLLHHHMRFVCLCNRSHMRTHSSTVHNTNTFADHDAQTQRCRLHRHGDHGGKPHSIQSVGG